MAKLANNAHIGLKRHTLPFEEVVVLLSANVSCGPGEIAAAALNKSRRSKTASAVSSSYKRSEE